MQLIKKYPLEGVPLLIDRGKFTESKFFLGGFPSLLAVVDTRLSQLASQFNLQKGAVTCIADSIHNYSSVAAGDREGNCTILDIRARKNLLSW